MLSASTSARAQLQAQLLPARATRVDNLTDLVGNTPLVRRSKKKGITEPRLPITLP